MIVKDETGQYKHIACNACGEHSPSAATLLANYGLEAMGWSIPRPDAHLCPECVADGVRLRAPADA